MRLTLLAIVLICLALPSSVAAFSAKDDKAKLFSADAVEQAATLTYEDREQYRKELRIRTYATVPWHKDISRRVPKMTEVERERFFTRWARSDARFVDGVYILICKQPLEVRVVTQFRSRTQPITAEDGEQLREKILALIQEDKNDQALLQAANYFHDRLYSVYGDTSITTSFDWSTLSSVLLGVVGAWLALHFLHGFSEGAFRVGSAGINPLGLDAGIGILAGLRAVREGLRQAPHVPPPVEDGSATYQSQPSNPDEQPA
jgi:hypothetical protein